MPIPGGRYDRNAAPGSPAAVSDFCLDKYEVTVGRFRAFVDAYDAWIADGHPAAGEGEHFAGYGSGWQAEWEVGDELPESASVFSGAEHLAPASQYSPTWTADASGDETLPVNWVGWYEAFAFCIWDGGRLPTEAEWGYAAGHGSENRVYPWGDGPATCDLACFDGCSVSPPDPVGTRASGDGFWGHSDLAGNLREWVFDGDSRYPTECNNCAVLQSASGQVLRGGGWLDPGDAITVATRWPVSTGSRGWLDNGVRCARRARP